MALVALPTRAARTVDHEGFVVSQNHGAPEYHWIRICGVDAATGSTSNAVLQAAPSLEALLGGGAGGAGTSSCGGGGAAAAGALGAVIGRLRAAPSLDSFMSDLQVGCPVIEGGAWGAGGVGAPVVCHVSRAGARQQARRGWRRRGRCWQACRRCRCRCRYLCRCGLLLLLLQQQSAAGAASVGPGCTGLGLPGRPAAAPGLHLGAAARSGSGTSARRLRRTAPSPRARSRMERWSWTTAAYCRRFCGRHMPPHCRRCFDAALPLLLAQAVERCQPLWGCLEDIDRNAHVLDPPPTVSAARRHLGPPTRRLALGGAASLQLRLDPADPRGPPPLQGGGGAVAFLGPPEHVEPLREAFFDRLHLQAVDRRPRMSCVDEH